MFLLSTALVEYLLKISKVVKQVSKGTKESIHGDHFLDSTVKLEKKGEEAV